MKIIIVISIYLTAALAAPAPSEQSAPLQVPLRFLPAIEQEEVREDDGAYSLRYVTAEGTIVSERARMVPTADGKDKVLIYEGEYSFRGTDGKTYVTKYSSDLDSGHKASGDHLPIAPEVVFVV